VNEFRSRGKFFRNRAAACTMYCNFVTCMSRRVRVCVTERPRF
jgi:hypothetical protein